jgi:hypothetical protein
MATLLRLYEEVDQLETVLDWLEEHEAEIQAAGGVLPPELEELLEQVEGTLTEKLERTALVVQNLTANAKAAKAEADRLASLASTYERQAESLKAYLHMQMQRAGIAKHQGARCKLWTQKNGRPSVRLADPEAIPEAFQRHIPARIEFDGQAAYQHLKEHGAIPEPEDGEVEIEGLVVSRGTHLRIR